jgi:uncharacterized damage-inducible protein DinB
VRLGTGQFPSGDVVPGEHESLDALLVRWREEEARLRALAASLDDGELSASPPGPDRSLTTWRCLLYVVNHGMQQFAEAALLLTQLGHSPGEIGYLAFCSERVRSRGNERP